MLTLIPTFNNNNIQKPSQTLLLTISAQKFLKEKEQATI